MPVQALASSADNLLPVLSNGSAVSMPPVITAYASHCRNAVLAWASLGACFAGLSAVVGVLSLRKSYTETTRSFLNFMMVCGVFLSTSMLVVTAYKYIPYATSRDNPVGAFELERGGLGVDGTYTTTNVSTSTAAQLLDTTFQAR